MAEKIIKARLFTWFEETDSPIQPGQTVLTERIAMHGQKVDITNDAFVKRGEELGAFYTDEEARQIEDGTYRGFDHVALSNARAGIVPTSNIEPIEGEGPGDISSLTTDEVAELISEGNGGRGLTVSQTLALLPPTPDVDTINKLYDAETQASGNEPRKGVTDSLDAKLAAASEAE